MPSTTYATREVDTVVDWLCWHRVDRFPLTAFSLGLVMFPVSLALLGPSDGLSIFGVLLSGVPISMAITRMKFIASYFITTDLIPGIVVRTDPFTIASMTDLTQSQRLSYPSVRVLPMKLESARGGPFHRGDRIPMAACYYGADDAPKWDTFRPIPLVFATSDRRELDELIARIPEGAWLLLNEALFQIPQPYSSGLFAIQPQHWPDVDSTEGALT